MAPMGEPSVPIDDPGPDLPSFARRPAGLASGAGHVGGLGDAVRRGDSSQLAPATFTRARSDRRNIADKIAPDESLGIRSSVPLEPGDQPSGPATLAGRQIGEPPGFARLIARRFGRPLRLLL